MNFALYDKDFNRIKEIDSFLSVIWNDRYAECGDVELCIPALQSNLDLTNYGYYLQCSESEHWMILEDIETTTDEQSGDQLIVRGRSLESLLERRIIWSQTTISGNLQNAIKKLLNENIISPSVTDRKISNFVFVASTDTAVTSLTIPSTQYTGDNLYEVVSGLCMTAGIGFKVTLNESNQFEFSLYAGTDRSYQQSSNPYVVFSNEFDNLVTSNYIRTISISKNVAEIGGEGEGSERYMTQYGTAAGLSRREVFIDARNISQTVDDTKMSDADYYSTLKTYGMNQIAENYLPEELFDAEVDVTQTYQIDRDFSIGDILQFKNSLSLEYPVRVSEIVRSVDQNGGITTLPTFTIL